MKIKYLIVLILCASTICEVTGQVKTSNSAFTNLFVGTGGHGHTYPGATVPFGLVQLSPDTDETGWDWCSGYNYQDSTIMGFSHTHLSGTGISDLADVLVMPYLGKIHLNAGKKDGSGDGFRSKFTHDEEIAIPGYYSVMLKKYEIKAKLTASENTGYHRYTFPRSDSANIIIDLQHGLDRFRSWLTERVLDSELKIIDSVTITGYRTSSGWANVQKLYFEMKFSKPFKSYGIAIHDVFRDESKLGRGRNVKGVVTFDTEQNEQIEVVVKISPDPIKSKLSRPLITFDSSKKTAQKIWSKQLNLLEIDAPDHIKTVLLTAWYHTALAPNKLRSSLHKTVNQDYYTEYGTLSQWDVYRSAFALNTLLRPEIVNGTLGTMLGAYDTNHYLPVWKLWGDEVNCMIGSPSVPMVSESIIKGYGIENKARYYTAVKNSLTIDNPVAPWMLFEKYGYVPNDKGELFSVSKTMEMSYAHGCAALLAKKLYPSDPKRYDYHFTRSRYYKNLFDPDTGFFHGKDSFGKFSMPFDPTVTNENEFVESTPWQYLFHVQHDIEEMISLFGGREKFTLKLDELFLANSGKIDDHILDITGLIGQYAHGNEPSHHVAYLYNYAGQPWKTQERIHDICSRFYTNTADGICGNEDCGQMSAWYIFSALGFYPVHPTSGFYDLGVPLVKGAVLNLPEGKKFEIRTSNYNINHKYVKSVMFNGKKLKAPKISHQQILTGGILEFELSQNIERECYK